MVIGLLYTSPRTLIMTPRGVCRGGGLQVSVEALAFCWCWHTLIPCLGQAILALLRVFVCSCGWFWLLQVLFLVMST